MRSTLKQDTFLALFAKHNQEFSRKVGYNRAEGTYSKYCTLYKHMENYIRYEYNREDIFLKEFNLAFINGFEHYLRTERECSTNTIWMYMIGVKPHYYYCPKYRAIGYQSVCRIPD